VAFWGGNASHRCFLRWRYYVTARRHKHQLLAQVICAAMHAFAKSQSPLQSVLSLSF
jgi:hypothetical protein